MMKWLAGLFDSLFGMYGLTSLVGGVPFFQKQAHQQMTEIEYRQWHPDLVTNKGISCYQCGGTEQQEITLSMKQGGVACARCKSILWRKATTL